MGKSSMMIPIASCLGQYKWWRLRRPTQLRELQILDEASRGPWGSLVMLFDLKVWETTIACCLGVVTILALGFEPSAQQVLEFPTREARLPNATAWLGALNRTFGNEDWVGSGNIRMDAALLNGALGSPQQGLFYCPTPATKCTWSNFTTLALCSETRRMNSNSDEVEDPFYVTPLALSSQFGSTSWLATDESGIFVLRLAVGRANVSSTDLSDLSDLDLWHLSHAEIVLITWRWCAKTISNPTATPLGLEFSSITEENLIKSDLVYNSGPKEDIDYLLAKSTGLIYQAETALFLDILRERLLVTDSMIDSNLYFFFSDDTFTADLENFATNIAETFNGMITSHYIRHNPYLQYLEGEVYYEEVYVHVRWFWFTLPILEMVLTTVFLVATIVLNREQPVFKNSVLPYLAHGLEGWQSGELDIQPPESVERLEEVLFKQIATLNRGQDGQLRLHKFEGFNDK
ncbi:hypothetical protein F4820DRAFT_465033 [Hypoxylon rubiginosum]|uniref:Uncharacterized protein n=1 Tax=Hypoxylon rubiginosum TaxID=110542 RepID=A0ACB9YP23_9PEZI|nr:hypothetical protein F4820DRAFT_465033 [Hypoxylon rubiginosum]